MIIGYFCTSYKQKIKVVPSSMKQNKLLFSLLLLCILALGFKGCKDFTSSDNPNNSIARVNSTYLTQDDLVAVMPLVSDQADSAAIAQQYIDKWATKRLLNDIAAFNLSDQKVAEIQDLVDDFKQDLLIKAYLEQLVQSKVDTVVRQSDLQLYYDRYKDSFIADDILVKLRYINVLQDNSYFSQIKKAFNSTKQNDLALLESLSLQMKSYALNDSIWVSAKQLYGKLPFLNAQNVDSYLKNNNNFEVVDENSTYFVKVNSIIAKGEIIPFDYMKSALRKLIINDRKVTLIKQIQEDIIKDAKNNKQYEIFK